MGEGQKAPVARVSASAFLCPPNTCLTTSLQVRVPTLASHVTLLCVLVLEVWLYRGPSNSRINFASHRLVSDKRTPRPQSRSTSLRPFSQPIFSPIAYYNRNIDRMRPSPPETRPTTGQKSDLKTPLATVSYLPIRPTEFPYNVTYVVTRT